MIATCKANYFKELTKGQEYHITDAYGSMFVVVNDLGFESVYHSSYFV